MQLISESDRYYSTPTVVQVGDKSYPKIMYNNAREFIDNDEKRKTVNHMESESSRLVVYVEGDRVVRASEYYDGSRTIKLGDRIYTNVVSKEEVLGRPVVYNVFTPTGHQNTIRVRRNGAVVDVNELKKQIIRRKLTQPFKRLASVFVR